MTDKILQLKQKVFETESPSRGLIVSYFKALVAEAKKLSVDERDDLAYEILRPFLELADPPEDDMDLEYIVFQLAGGGLDLLTEDALGKCKSAEDQAKGQRLKAAIWQELIERVEALTRNYYE